MTELGYTSSNPISGIKNKRAVASINRAFEPDELTALLAYLKEHDRVLYRVSILMYTTFLRPHKEIRLLRARYFDLKSGLLILPSRYTKNGKQVTIPLQTLVKDELSFIAEMQPDDFVFGVVNPDYFSTRWGKKIRGVYPLKENQTLYSIRHTAAVDMYKRTKDVALIQNLMRHSSMEVTLGYLRSLNCNVSLVSAELYPNLFLG
jgi:integrase